MVLEVPEVDARGEPLSELYRLEIVPNLIALARFPRTEARTTLTGDDLPRLVDLARQAIAAGDDGLPPMSGYEANDAHADPLAHYLVGLRLLDVKLQGGVAAEPGAPPKGVFGGSLIGIRGDTRGGDFSLVRFDLNHTAERGMIAGFSLLRSDAVYFCHDPETRKRHPPLLSLLGPCARGEWLGFGGSVAEAFHDGRTGRTAIRPVSAYAVVNVLGNGQSPSYDGLRFLLRGGGAVEHVWTSTEGGATFPRAGGNAVVLARTPDRNVEVQGGVGYRVDVTSPNDAAFESSLALRWYFLLGGNRTSARVDGVDPWGVGSLGLEGGYSFWTRPRHSFADVALPFASAERSGTWQLLLTATLGFEGLTF
jgi:hypothetical protein